MERCEIDTKRCKGCGLCVEVCPRHCLSLDERLNAIGYHPARLHDPAQCTSCALCAQMCPEVGIVVNKRIKARG
jgi:2-oxoglutarate ferredoxin oxidoreductase subunit delta